MTPSFHELLTEAKNKPMQNIYASVDIISRIEKIPLEVDSILNVVCAHFKLLPECLMKGAGRYPLYVTARQLAVLICMDEVPFTTLNGLGIRLGGYDHTTILYSRVNMRNRIYTDAIVRGHYKQILEKLGINKVVDKHEKKKEIKFKSVNRK